MEQEIPENVKRLAETLKKSGLAASDADAIEKAKESLKAHEIVKKAQDKDNYFKSQKDKTVGEILKESPAEKTEEKTPKKEESAKIEEKASEEGKEKKEDIEIKEMESVEEVEEQDSEEDSGEEE